MHVEGLLEVADCFSLETCAHSLDFQNTFRIRNDLGLKTRHTQVEVDLSLQNASGWRLGLMEKACTCRGRLELADCFRLEAWAHREGTYVSRST